MITFRMTKTFSGLVCVESYGKFTWYFILLNELLPATQSTPMKVYIFQQDNSLAHCARQTMELLRREIPEFTVPNLWPPNSQGIKPVY